MGPRRRVVSFAEAEGRRTRAPSSPTVVKGGMALVRARDVQLLVNAEDRPASDGQVFDRVNPVTKTICGSAAAATIADADAAVAAAAAAFPDWSRTGPSLRRGCLLKAAGMVEQRSDEFAAVMAEETGATNRWSAFNVRIAAAMLRESASLTTRITGEIIPGDIPGATSFAMRQPVGVVLSIPPWNAPLILGVRSVATPLACGNTVVLKSSELCPQTHRLIGEIMLEAGMAGGVVNVLSNAPGDADRVVHALIAHPAVRRINFTGSTRVGRSIALMAAQHLKPVLLELGGKAPLVVLADADLEAAAQAAAFGAFFNQGQICMSTERLIVEAPVADRFAKMVAGLARPLVAGDRLATDVPLGPVIGTDAVRRLKGLVEDAVSKGAQIIAGGGFHDTCMDATVIDYVTPSMRIYREESFGPVAALIRVGDAEEAVRVANDTEYGLAASVYSSDFSRAFEVAMQIDSGICHINSPTVQDEPQMPYGGVRDSGHGRFGGTAAINEFTELRWISYTARPGEYPDQAFLMDRCTNSRKGHIDPD
jgi:acyl-CoA reductase-like NAD-dependent aldehyde dehydrogenase